MLKKGFQYISVYVLVTLLLVVGLWVFLLAREVITGWMRVYYVGESLSRGYQAGFVDRMITLLLGLGWLVFFVVVEELLRRQAARELRMLRTFARFMGAALLTALVLDSFMLVFLTGLAAVGWLRWLVLAAELILGGLFVFLGWSKHSPWREKHIPGVFGQTV